MFDDGIGGDGSGCPEISSSENRAAVVAQFLVETSGFAAAAVATEAYGESRPIATNDTAEGRQRNRRVEITVTSDPPYRDNDQAKINIHGIWETSEGLMELQQEGDEVVGLYDDSGRIAGQFTSDIMFEGYWIEERSARSCESARLGSNHWGAIRFESESAARDTFTVSWSYCEDETFTTDGMGSGSCRVNSEFG